jgi:hypothetical protein
MKSITKVVRINYNYGCSSILNAQRWEDVPEEEHVDFVMVTVNYDEGRLAERSENDLRTLKVFYGFKVVEYGKDVELYGIPEYEWEDHMALAEDLEIKRTYPGGIYCSVSV